MRRQKLILVLSLAVVAAMMLAACAPAPAAQPTAQEVSGEENVTVETRGTFRIAHPKEFSGKASLDPCSPTRWTPLISILYDRLVEPDDNNVPSPSLAESWEVDETATRWTFHLRDAVFHDGSPVTAADVAYTLRHCLDPDTESPIASTLGLIDPEGFEILDDKTIVINLTQPHADFTMLLMDYRARIIKEGSLENIEEAPIGSGPFKLETKDLDGTTVLVAHDEYWKGPPNSARIEVIGIADADARNQALLAGQIDYGGIQASVLPLFEGRENFEVLEAPSGGWRVLVMNTQKPPFDDVRVRKAMKLVVDRQAMLDIVLQGHGTIAYDHPVWPGDQYYAELPYERDVEKAKQLLAEAGYPDGLEVDLYISEVDGYFNPMAVAYKEMAAEAGITVNIQQVPTDGYWNEIWLVKPFMASYWGERTADQVLNEVFRSGASWNETFFANPKYDAILDQARLEIDFEKRKALYQEAQRILQEEGGAIIPFFINTLAVKSDRVEEIKIFPEFDYHLVKVKPD